jgi:serine/threonine protein kinase
VPAALDQIVLRALAKNPDERYLTGEQFRADLTAFLASNRDYVATDSERVRAFMRDLFDEDIERERRQREELLETVHERLQENLRQELAEREAAEQRQQRRADLLAAIEGKGEGDGEGGRIREGEIPGQVIRELEGYDTDKMIGRIIERWKILSKIGEGGMGRVFEAEHTEIGRRVAIKILHPVYSRTPEVVARFRMEARAASRIGHPNIIEVTDSGTTLDGSFYFVMELLEGIDLADRLKKEKQLPITDALQVATQVAQALGAAHQINIVHRDLKPENIFLINREGNPNFVKVLDFGIAKSLEEEKIRRLTTPGMAMGTPEYMAPEQATGKGSDARSDIYSLGAILYEMLAGKAPIAGDTMMDILIRKATEDPVDLAVLRPDCPQAVSQLVMRTLARNPENRPQTMAELAQEINRLLTDIQSGVVPIVKVPFRPPSSPTGPTNQVALEHSGPTASENQLHRRRLLIGGVILSGGLLGIGISLYMALFPTTTLVQRNADMAVDQGRSVDLRAATPPPPAPHDGGTGGAPIAVAPRPDMASTHTVETPANPPSGKKMLYDHVIIPPFMDRADAFAKIEEGKLAIGGGRPDVGFTMCVSAAGNPQVRGHAFTCMGEAEFGRNRMSEAVKLGKLALKWKGPAKDTNLLLGKVYYKLRDCKNAKSFWQRVLNIDSTNPEALAGMSKCP